MTIVSLLNPIVRTHGELLALVGESINPSGIITVMDINTKEVSNMPNPEEGTVYLVPFGVFMALKETRSDLVMFDSTKAIKDPVTGWVISQGGLLHS